MTDEVADIEWPGDKLNRKKDSKFLTKYINERYKLQEDDQSFVLNVNAEWGFGKTFFLKRWKDDLSENHPVIYYDAWNNDFSKHPLASFLYVFENQLAEYLSDTEEFKGIFKGLVSSAIKYSLILGGSYTASIKEAYNEYYNNQDEIRNEIDKFMGEIKKLANYFEKNSFDYGLPIFVMVDEMDRCRPSYSIELLEVIKHLFSTKYICFIVSTDSRQLEKSIKVIYGNEFDSGKYLNRFFDHEYSLSEPNNEQFSNYLINKYDLEGSMFFTPLDSLNKTFSLIASYFRLSLREQQYSASLLEAVKLTAVGNLPDNVNNIDVFFMLFLIMYRLSNKEGFDKYEQSYDKSEYIKNELVDSLKVNSMIMVPAVRYHQDSSGFDSREEKEEVSLIDIINKYHAELGKNLVKGDWHPESENLDIFRKIMQRLYDQRPNPYNRHVILNSDLVNYLRIVKRVGQLS